MWQQNKNTSALNSRRHQEASASNPSGWKTELTGAWNDWAKGRSGGAGGGKERRVGRGASQASLLDSTQRLHLEGLSVGAPFSVVFVLAAVSIALQDVLVAAVAGELVAHPATAGGGREAREEAVCDVSSGTKMRMQIFQWETSVGNLRSTLNLHGSDLVVAPAHGLQRGVVIGHLPLVTHEVLLPVQHHLGLFVVLWGHSDDNLRGDRNLLSLNHNLA